MNCKVTLASLTAGLLTVSAFAAAPAQAGERTCRGTIGSTTVDDLLVPQGATCTLDGTTVKGTITVKGDATLRAAHVRVVGNVQSENAKRVVLRGSSVGGSVQHVQGGSAKINNNRVNGDVQMFSNNGEITITRNRIDGNLQCNSNNPAPTGGNNTVGGNKEDQCRSL